jgi:hypothetical protein
MGHAAGNLASKLSQTTLDLGVSRTMTEKQPNPGSPEAVEKGCKCPVMDNHYGKGFPLGKENEPMFWVSFDCPLHGEK